MTQSDHSTRPAETGPLDAREVLPGKTSTVTVELTGGLANQVFQWAAGYLLARQLDATLRLDARLVIRPDGRGYQLGPLIPDCEVLRPGDREQKWWAATHRVLPKRAVGALKRARRLHLSLGCRVAASYSQAREIGCDGAGLRLRGLFQEVGELLPHRDLLRAVLLPQIDRLRPSPMPAMYSAAHVRRGDYVSVPKYNKLYGVCSADYYRSGVAALPVHLPLIMATDDRVWTAELLAGSSWESASMSPATDHFGDFAVMAGATQQVLSNSTFSWWAAFLGSAETVIAPDPWFTDASRDRSLPLPEWRRLPRDPVSS